MSAPPDNLADHLRERIRARGESLSRIARGAGVFPSQLSRLLNGRRSVSLATASRLLAYLERPEVTR